MTEERSAVVGGLRMRWLEEGDGDAVVCVYVEARHAMSVSGHPLIAPGR